MTERRFLDLGPLEVRIDGRQPSLGGRIPTAILAVLLINLNRRVGPDTLTDAVWGDDGSARTTLATHVWRLRNVLEPDRERGVASPLLVNDAGGYRLVASVDALDSGRFEETVTEAARLLRLGQPERALRRADEGLSLWRGRPFDAVADQAWAAPVVAKFGELHVLGRRHRIDALLELGRPGDALASLQTLIGEDPINESLWARRILAEYRSGRVGQALDSYQQIRRLLDDELGLEPGPELRELQQRVLGEDPSLLAVRKESPSSAPAPEPHLPSLNGRVVGRNTDLASVSGLVRRGPVTTVVGAAGCGKTTLAILAARSSISHFVDGVVFIDLSVASEPDQVPALVAAGLQAPALPSGSVHDAVRAAVRGRRMLLVLDNAEHVLDATADLISALSDVNSDSDFNFDSDSDSDSDLSFLVTSREPLLVPGERLYRLAPLEVYASSSPNATGADAEPVVGRPSAAAELFLDRIASSPPPTSAQLRVVEQICAVVDGLPLAIELAAARHQAFTLPEILDQVREDVGTLQTIGRARSDHHRTLRSAIDRSYHLLSADEQDVHRKLALVPRNATVEAVAALTRRSTADVQPLLASLVHKSLLTVVASERPAGRTRFRQLATVRAHADHQLIGAERDEAADRLDGFTAEVVRARGRRGRPEEATWMELLDDNLDAIRASLSRNLHERPEPAGVDLLSRIGIYWYFRGLMVEARGWHHRAVSILGSLDPLTRALIEMGIGSGHCWRSRGDLAREPIRAAMARTDSETYDASLPWGEQVAIASYGIFAAQERQLGRELSNRLQRIAAATGDRELEAFSAAAAVLAGAMNDSPHSVLSAADAVYPRLVEVDNLLATWFLADGATAAAVAVGDPDAGRRWSDRAVEACRRLRVGEGSVLFEQRANVFALAADYRTASSLYSAAQLHQRGNGLIDWNFPYTAGLLRVAQTKLTPTEWAQAWESGSTRSDLAHRSGV